MAQRKKTGSNRVLILVLGVAFGIIALAMAYRAVMGSTESRSKAAQADITVASWPGEGRLLSEWSTSEGVALDGNSFKITAQNEKVTLKNIQFSPAVTLPKGNKYVVVTFAQVGIPALAVTSTPTPSPAPVLGATAEINNAYVNGAGNTMWSVGGGAVGSAPGSKKTTSSFRGTLTYWVQSAKKAGLRTKKTVVFTQSGPVLRVRLNDIAQVSVDGLQIDITKGFTVGQDVAVEQISLVTPLTVLPTPAPIEKGESSYTCPANGWVDCMPSLVGDKMGTRSSNCTQAYYDWAKKNCKNFQGFAR